MDSVTGSRTTITGGEEGRGEEGRGEEGRGEEGRGEEGRGRVSMYYTPWRMQPTNCA